MSNPFRLAATLFPAPVLGATNAPAAPREYPNVKRYVDFHGQPKAFRSYNYASRNGLTWSNPGTEVYRVVFLELGECFNLLLMPPSERTAYVLTRDDATPWPGMSSRRRRAVTNPARKHREVPRHHPGLVENWTDEGILKANSHGGSGTVCGVQHYFPSAGGLEVDVVCNNASHVLADRRFILLATTRH